MEVDLTPVSATGEEVAEVPTIKLDLLSLIDRARNEHGMRQQDFERYRRFCVEKLHRLRSSLHLTHNDGTSTSTSKKQRGASSKRKKGSRSAGKQKAKRKTKTQPQTASKKAGAGADERKGNVFTRQTIRLADVRNDRPLQLLLFEAERAWANSQELRARSFANDQDAELRRHGIQRARKAARWAGKLQSLVFALDKKGIDARTRAQTAAYTLIMRASVAFDRQDSRAALPLLSVLRSLLTLLASAAPSSRDQALADSFIDATEPQMRFCVYQLGDSSTDDMDAIARGIADKETCETVVPGYAELVDEVRRAAAADPAVTRASKEPLHLEWRGQSIPVRNAELLDAIVRARAEEEALAKVLETEKAEGSKKSHPTNAEAEGASATQDKSGKGQRRARLTHAQRNAKKRASRAAASSSSDDAGAAAAAAAAVASSGSRRSGPGAGPRAELDPFDRALGALADAEELARGLVEDNARALAKSHSSRYEAASQDLRRAHDWLVYRLLSLRVRRNARLVHEVEQKAERREVRAARTLEVRLDRAQRRGRGSGARGGGSREKTPKSKDGATDAKRRRFEFPVRQHRKPGPGSRAKRARSREELEKKRKRRPGHSGTRKLRQRKAARFEAQLRATEAERAKRRRARAVPGVARLLDAAEASLATVAGLSIVEREPDVSSVVEAKAAWYRAELLRQLGSAYALGAGTAPSTSSGALSTQGHEMALLLLGRAALYVRQARESASLVGAGSAVGEDADAPPHVLDEATLQRTERRIEAQRAEAQRHLFFAQRGVDPDVASVAGDAAAASAARRRSAAVRAGSASKGVTPASKGRTTTTTTTTKASQAMRELAEKHVAFDAVDVDEACRLDDARRDELEVELRSFLAAQRRAGQPPPTRRTLGGGRSQTAPNRGGAAEEDEEGDDAFEEAPDEPYDAGNRVDDEEEQEEWHDQEEEEEQQQQQQQRGGGKGWLGGWFGRK